MKTIYNILWVIAILSYVIFALYKNGDLMIISSLFMLLVYISEQLESKIKQEEEIG